MSSFEPAGMGLPFRLDSFADENENPIDSGFTFSITKNSLKAGDEKTTVQVVKKMASLAELEQFIAIGYEKGTAMGMNNLDEYFNSLVTEKSRPLA